MIASCYIDGDGGGFVGFQHYPFKLIRTEILLCINFTLMGALPKWLHELQGRPEINYSVRYIGCLPQRDYTLHITYLGIVYYEY